MKRFLSAALLCGTLGFTAPTPAVAALFDSNPLSDFLTIFRQPGVASRTVQWTGKYGPGTVVVSTSARKLYFVQGNGTAIEYGVGVGRQGFT